MKKTLCFLLAGMLVICLAACGSNEFSSASENSLPADENGPLNAADDVAQGESNSSWEESDGPSPADGGLIPNGDFSDACNITFTEDKTLNEGGGEEAIMGQNTFYVTVGGEIFSASFADNSGAQALKELLAGGYITIQMSDYGGFEKVGSLGQSLPTENSQTTTQAGDIVLYQGNQIVIFYGSNSWSYTRLGKIDDLTGWEEALGTGDIGVTFSLQGE